MGNTRPILSEETEAVIIEAAVEQLGVQLAAGARDSDHLLQRLHAVRDTLQQRIFELERWT